MGEPSRVASAFSGANAYAQYAWLQRRVADHLAQHIRQQRTASAQQVLEIGCGTGFLTEHLIADNPHADFLITDISTQMVQRCRTAMDQINSPNSQTIHYATMDGQHPSIDTTYELIASSLAFQWFDDLDASIALLSTQLEPGSMIAFSTLGAETFHQWRSACKKANVPCATPNYPEPDALNNRLSKQATFWMHVERIHAEYPSAWPFLQELRHIGAHRPRSERQPASTGRFRALLRRLEHLGNFQATYQIIYGILTV
ncbi:MAG: methyltransferase [Magnetococcales bacterium]|nr:methyltransferase [Magnetococcales bacterium]